MSVHNLPRVALGTRTRAPKGTQPIFARLPARYRPYLLASGLVAATSALMYVGDAAMMRFGFSWALVSLLLVVVVASLWKERPALLALVLSALYGILVVPHVQPSPLQQTPAWHVLILRTVLFVVCGGVTIWLTYRARLMQGRAETRHEVLLALRSMILPDVLAAAPGYDLNSIYEPLHQEEEVGGDFYDFYKLEGGRYGVLIGDVMGKGKEAAVSIALLRYSIRAFSSSDAHPAHVLEQLNHLIETQGLPFTTASLFFGFLDPSTGLLCYTNAGHEPPLLKGADGREALLDSTGPILGLGLGAAYQQESIVLSPGDSLLLMTDGVSEARNNQGEFLESDGVWRLFRNALRASGPPNALVSLSAALTNFIGTNRCDDIAMLLLRRQETQAS